MFRFRRWWLLFGAVLVGVVALNGVVDAKAVAARGAVCVRVGAKALDGVSGRGLVCVQTKVRGLRWRFAPTAVTTPTIATSTSATTTVASANVAPRVVSASSASGNAVITIADMSPDTGVYAVQWVSAGQSFNSYQMYRTTTKTMTVPYLSCTRTYTLRVFVMQANWQMTDGFVNQNVTPHSATFDLTMPACTATAATTTTVALTCATGGTCAVGDTGPGGGIVFYVASTNFTSTGSDCGTTCKYLEAASSDQSTGIVWATTGAACYALNSSDGNLNCQTNSIYAGADQATSRTAATPIGMGMANTNQIYARISNGGGIGGALTSAYAAGIAWAYDNNSKTDWHLPSKDELNELCKYARTQTTGDTAVICANTGTIRSGFSTGLYWSSSEHIATSAWGQVFVSGFQYGSSVSKNSTDYVRPVRAF